jgi:hypothetical protein
LLALTEVMQAAAPDAPPRRVEIQLEGAPEEVVLTSERPAIQLTSTASGKGRVLVPAVGDAQGQDSDTEQPQVVVRAETRWIPEAPGSEVEAEAQGFVVMRELFLESGNEDEPPRRLPLESAGASFTFEVGDVIEDHVQIVSPTDRFHVAVVVPLAAGMEPLNPSLATAPPEAKPRGRLSHRPSYSLFADDRVAFYFDSLPKGTLDLYFRTRATTAGRFIQPPAMAELMYDGAVRGNGNGAVVEIIPAAE